MSSVPSVPTPLPPLRLLNSVPLRPANKLFPVIVLPLADTFSPRPSTACELLMSEIENAPLPPLLSMSSMP